jgi:predicted ATP-grasp superfamily ATP-dependent carboligase
VTVGTVIPESLLVIASSARMLAQAAKASGLKPLVIDLFADQDTRACAEAFRQVDSLAEADIAAAVDDFIKYHGVAQVVYGGGFECYPESLRYLGDRLNILGNAVEVFTGVQDKKMFFSCLERLKIPYPAVLFDVPASDGDWLVKPHQGRGGIGIKRWHAGDGIASASVYWQRYVEGEQNSVLFLADGNNAQVVGFNRQWTEALDDAQAFVFSGISNDCPLHDAHKALIEDWLKRLVPIFALKGLNSLDFIRSGERINVLEINARPPASMQLYDQDLLIRHIKASWGDLLDRPFGQAGYTGYRIIYAASELRIPEPFAWPPWCLDRPESGALIGVKQPICSIIAHSKKSRRMWEMLAIRQRIIVNKLNQGIDRYGIYSKR